MLNDRDMHWTLTKSHRPFKQSRNPSRENTGYFAVCIRSTSARGGAQGKDKRFDSDGDHLRHAHRLANVDVVKVTHVNVVDGDDGAVQFEFLLENCAERPSHVYVQHQKQGSSRWGSRVCHA